MVEFFTWIFHYKYFDIFAKNQIHLLGIYYKTGQKFSKQIFKKTYIVLLGLSWPFHHRLSINNGQRLTISGLIEIHFFKKFTITMKYIQRS